MATTSSSAGHPSGSGSATTIVPFRNCVDIKIVGYTKSLNTGKSKPAFNSPPFSLGGCTWHLSYRPKGSTIRGSNDFISFYLVLVDSVHEPVTARFTLSLLDQNKNPVEGYCTTSGSGTFNFSVNRSYGCEEFINREDLQGSGYLKDDCFVMRVRILIVKEAPPIVVPPSDMQRHLGNLLSIKEGADVEFQVGGETFLAHRLVLGMRSPVFKAKLYGPMKEGATRNIIQIDDMEPQVFEALLTFIYTDSWPQMEQEDESAMTQHLLVAADRYGLQRLKLLCEYKLHRHIDKDSVAIILVLAEKHHCRGLKKACFDFLNSWTAPFADIDVKGFEYLAQSCPSLMKYIIDIALARGLEEAKISEEIGKAINHIDRCGDSPSVISDS